MRYPRQALVEQYTTSGKKSRFYSFFHVKSVFIRHIGNFFQAHKTFLVSSEDKKKTRFRNLVSKINCQ